MALAGTASATAAQVTLRHEHPDLPYADARTMNPAALGDALLAPGHPPVVEVSLWPRGMGAPPPPPGSPVRLELELSFAATLDRPSGFCVRRSVTVTTMRPGTAEPETIEPQTVYRLPSDGADACGGVGRVYFAPHAADRPRAFAVVRLVAAAVRASRRGRPTFPVTVDDQEGRELATDGRPDSDPRIAAMASITDPHAALADLPVDVIGYVGHQLFGSSLLAPELLAGHGGVRERWSLLIGSDWTMDVVLDGDTIAAMALRRRIPPPF